MNVRTHLFDIPEFDCVFNFLDKKSLGYFTLANKTSNNLVNSHICFQNSLATLKLLSQRIASSFLDNNLINQHELLELLKNPNIDYKIHLLIQLEYICNNLIALVLRRTRYIRLLAWVRIPPVTFSSRLRLSCRYELHPHR